MYWSEIEHEKALTARPGEAIAADYVDKPPATHLEQAVEKH
jgi:hypothetical protein